jgi:hypothetical protein
VPAAHQVTANIVTGAYQIPSRFLFHAGHGNRDHLTQV